MYLQLLSCYLYLIEAYALAPMNATESTCMVYYRVDGKEVRRQQARSVKDRPKW